MRTFMFRCVAALAAAWGMFPAGAQEYLDLTETGASSYSEQIATEITLRKYGAGTITMNRNTGNGQVIAGLQVCEGTLILTGANAWGGNEGYFGAMTGTMEVQTGAVLQTAASNGAINRETPVWLNGGTLNVYADCFVNNIRLTGGTIQDNKGSARGTQTNRWRACTGVDITVDGGAQSLIAADLCLVVWNQGSDPTFVNFNVDSTGDASGIDLNFTGAIYDHTGGYGGNYLVKQGAGVMQLSYGENAWVGGSEVQDGTLQFTGANSLGTGGVTMNGGTLKSLAPSGSNVRNAVTMAAAGGTISANSGDATTFASLAGSGALQVFGSVGFAGNGGYTGTVTVGDTANVATLALSNGAAGTFSAVLNAGRNPRSARPKTCRPRHSTGRESRH